MPPKKKTAVRGSLRVAMKVTSQQKRDADQEKSSSSSDSDRSEIRSQPLPHPLPLLTPATLEQPASDVESTTSTQPAQKKAKKTRKKAAAVEKLHLPDDQEIEIADWLKTNDFIYRKGNRNFRDTQMKTKRWTEKALELNVPLAGLMTWYDSIRTKVGKLTKDKSGQATSSLSDRDAFIMTNFRFLQDHIIRMTSRTAFSVSILKT